MDSFTRTVLAGDTTAVITLTGVALDPAASSGSVRSVVFEMAATCTADMASSSNTIVSVAAASMSANAQLTALSIPLSSTVGLSAGSWSVCVDWRASGVSSSYVRVGTTSASILAG